MRSRSLRSSPAGCGRAGDLLSGRVPQAFDATGELRAGTHPQIWIGDALPMVSTGGAREIFPAFLYTYVEDVKETCGRVRDPWGNVWQDATHMKR